MHKYLPLVLLITIMQGCKKDRVKNPYSCDVHKARAENVLKVSINKGVWGTITFTEGDCMPKIIGTDQLTCKTCTAKRTVKIYEYTTRQQATPNNSQGFFDSFSTKLIKEVDADNNGFFQAELPAGKYSMAVIENGKLYVNVGDVQGGLAPFTVTDGLVNYEVNINYRAAY